MSPQGHLPSGVQTELVRRAKAGDRASIEQLLSVSRPRARRLSARFTPPAGMDAADLEQEGVLGVLSALTRWDPGRGVPFLVYADFWIYARMQRVVERAGRSIPAMSLDALTGDPGAANEALTGWVEPIEEQVVHSFERAAARAHLKELPERLRQIVWYRLSGYTCQEISAWYGISRQRVAQLEQEGYQRLRRAVPAAEVAIS